ncbi:MAG: carboxylating nicotinate-nucleotide diphosphorylase [Planctomycetales bacterium]|nr:carboxylating nicotinate-nucleotide diphosphorylase [Planctomycetales bacterium]
MPQEFDIAERMAAARLIELALEEDLGAIGDVTTDALIRPDERGAVKIVARQAGVLVGMPVAKMVFEQFDRDVLWTALKQDGSALQPGTVVGELSGSVRSLLSGERTTLNFLTHLSGIATLTRRYVDAVAGSSANIFDTRKTLPGWRVLEKYAVRCGGGRNHRVGLFDMVLIKDNHLAGWKASGADHSVSAAVHAARSRVASGIPIEVEVDTLEQLTDALSAAPNIVLLDNMNLATLRQAVELRNRMAPRVELEASGGVNLNTVADIARTGVERISVGALTHSAPALDLAFDWKTSK